MVTDYQKPEIIAPHPEKYTGMRKKLEKNVFKDIEEGRRHNPYDQELREQAAIEQGDMEALKRSFEEVYSGDLGKMGPDELRSYKNVSIAVITLASRSAIRGGMSPEVAFSMADLWIQKVEEQTEVLATAAIMRAAEYEFTQMVHEIRSDARNQGTEEQEESEHVTNAKNYIYQHMHGRVSVQEIADALGLNANYLSGLFKKCEGITMTEYILRGKVTLVKNLLIYSAYSFGEIASYLGFSSQSHLGAVFKKQTGMTMREYRKKYQMQEFIG